MSISSGFSTISISDLKNKISEMDIASFYFGITEFPSLINAPYRTDNKPSVSIFISRGKVKFKDFATNETGDIFTLLKLTWRVGLGEVISRINRDINLLKSRKTSTRTRRFTRSTIKEDVTIECKVREWKDYDIKYWETYGVSLPWLKFGDVYPISQIIYSKQNSKRVFPAEKLAYAYVERKDKKVTLKIYQPLSTSNKWINKHDSSVWDLWTKLPRKGEKLIITSSRKDALCIWENTGIPSVSLQGEGYIPKKSVVEELKNRFKYIFILYDNDFQSEVNHGKLFGEHLAKEFGLIQLEIPEKYKSKDTSDLAKNWGRKTVYEVIHNIINSKIN